MEFFVLISSQTCHTRVASAYPIYLVHVKFINSLNASSPQGTNSHVIIDMGGIKWILIHCFQSDLSAPFSRCRCLGFDFIQYFIFIEFERGEKWGGDVKRSRKN
jgi:hypothetical protein